MTAHNMHDIGAYCRACDATRIEIEDGMAPAECWGNRSWRMAWQHVGLSERGLIAHYEGLLDKERDDSLRHQLRAVEAEVECARARARGVALGMLHRFTVCEPISIGGHADILAHTPTMGNAVDEPPAEADPRADALSRALKFR